MSKAKEERDKAAHLRKLFDEAEKLLNRKVVSLKHTNRGQATVDIQCYDKSITGFKLTQHRSKKQDAPVVQSTKTFAPLKEELLISPRETDPFV